MRNDPFFRACYQPNLSVGDAAIRAGRGLRTQTSKRVTETSEANHINSGFLDSEAVSYLTEYTWSSGASAR